MNLFIHFEPGRAPELIQLRNLWSNFYKKAQIVKSGPRASPRISV